MKRLVASVVLLASGASLGCTSSAVQLGARWRDTPIEEFYTSDIVNKYSCTACHTIGNRGGTVGPVLNNVGYRRDKEWLHKWLEDPNAVKNGTPMPKFPFSPTERERTVEFLARMKLGMKTQEILSSQASAVEQGAKLFEDFDCYACHRIGDRGRFIGPNLTWVARRKSREWEKVWLKDPPGFKPGTFMPNFRLNPETIDVLTAFLHTLDGRLNEESRSRERLSVNFFGFSRKEHGKLVFDRLACWTCHGERLRQGVPNRNAAPGEKVPDIFEKVVDLSEEVLRKLLETRMVPKKLDPNGPEPFYSCPDYPNAVDGEELGALLVYLKSLGPKQSKWKFKF